VSQVRLRLVEALLAVARFGILPGFARPVQDGLRDAVQDGGAGPLAGVRGQAGQAQGGVGGTAVVAVAAPAGHGRGEPGPRTVRVTVQAQHPAQVDQQGIVSLPDRLPRLGRLFQVSPGGGQVAPLQGGHAGVVVQDAGAELVAGAPGGGDGLGVKRLGPRRVDDAAAHEVPGHGLAEDDVIA
jgi:hypothetical protein